MAIAVKELKVRQGHCPRCGPKRSADIVGEHVSHWADEDNQVQGTEEFYILQCRGCSAVYFQKDESDSESYYTRIDPVGGLEYETEHRITHWPAPAKRDRPRWSARISLTDSNLGALFEDIYGALNADLHVPAAISIRTAIDSASELLGVDPAISFAEKMNELERGRKISGDEKVTLSVLVDAGSAAAHRAWRPQPGELETMMSLLEAFLHRTFVLGPDAKQLRQAIPPKLARRKRGGSGGQASASQAKASFKPKRKK